MSYIEKQKKKTKANNCKYTDAIDLMYEWNDAQYFTVNTQ